MDITWGQLVAALGGWAVISGAVAGFLSKLLTERLISKWRRDEKALVETLRAQIERSQALFQAAIGSFQAGQAAALEERLSAVQRLWRGVLEVRDAFSGVLFFFTILLPSEYDDALRRDDTLAAGVKDLDDEVITEKMQRTLDLESDRPLLGEVLWLRFFVYHAFMGRLAHVFSRGKSAGHVEDWRLDPGIKQILSFVLPERDVEAIIGSPPQDVGALQRAVNQLESLILEEISQLASGARSSEDSFQRAKELREVVDRLGPFGVGTAPR
jgi:hypothetical protein